MNFKFSITSNDNIFLIKGIIDTCYLSFKSKVEKIFRFVFSRYSKLLIIFILKNYKYLEVNFCILKYL